MTEWKEYKLGELLGKKGYIRGPFGSALKRPEMKSEGFAVYEQQHAIYNTREFRYFIDDIKFSELKRFSVLPNDLIISCSGTVGQVSIINDVDPKGIISQALLTLRPNLELVSPKFLYYFFKTRNGYNQLLSASHGSVQVNIAKREVVESIPISVPNIETQNNIAEILSSFDDKIELNNQINKDLEALAQALFKQWFIDFNFPNENGKPYRSSGGEMVDSELGVIPKGWEICLISDVFDILSGFPFKSEEFVESGEYKIATIKNVQDGKFVTKTDNCINVLPKKIPEYIILNQGDILLSLTGNVGRSCFVPADKFLLNQRVAKIQLKGSNSTALPYYFFRRGDFQQLLISIAKGTAQLNLSPIEIKSLKIAFPSVKNRFSLDIFDSFFQQQLKNEVESLSLSELRDTLLPKLISGELEVSDIQTKIV